MSYSIKMNHSVSFNADAKAAKRSTDVEYRIDLGDITTEEAVQLLQEWSSTSPAVAVAAKLRGSRKSGTEQQFNLNCKALNEKGVMTLDELRSKTEYDPSSRLMYAAEKMSAEKLEAQIAALEALLKTKRN